MSTAWQKHDFAAEDRRRRLWEQQPVKRDWVAWMSWITCVLICVAWTRLLIIGLGKLAMWLREVL